MAGLVLDDDSYPSREQVEERMAAYSTPANPEYGLYTDRQVSWNTCLVMDWVRRVSDNTYLAGAFHFPCLWGGVDGVMLCVSFLFIFASFSFHNCGILLHHCAS